MVDEHAGKKSPRCRSIIAAVLCGLTLAAASRAWGQESPPAPEARPATKADTPADAKTKKGKSGVWDLLRASGSVGAIIILLSIGALALTLEILITIRRKNLLPPGLAHELHAHITNGEYTQAEQLCKLRPSYLSYVVMAGLQEVRQGYSAVEKAMEDASQEQASRLFRKVEYLAVIGNIAPMLGLLGTVYGILLAFKQVAESQGAAVASDLADGVYLALVTTVEGLVVAIPTLSAYALFRSWIEQLSGEVNLLSEQIFVNYKRSRPGRRLGHFADTAT